MAALGIVATAIVLLVSSGFDIQLGLPTFLAGAGHRDPGADALASAASTDVAEEHLLGRAAAGRRAVRAGGGAGEDRRHPARWPTLLQQLVQQSATLAAWASGVVLAVGCNLVNNLPAGLVAGRVVELAHVPEHVRSAVLIGVDLGPNLSVTGSLATILWLTALRREGQHVSAWTFLKLGALVMPPALLLAIAGAFAFG